MQQKLEALQDLRGIAIFLVVLFHAGGIFDLTSFRHGGIGVSLFFMISGFVIAYVHAKDNGLREAFTFAKKRVARVYAPYIPPLLAMLVLFWWTGSGSEYHRDLSNILKNVLLVQKPSESIHPYAWSLVYEIFYYFTFCVGVIILRLPVLAYCAILALPPLLYINERVDPDMLVISINNLYFIFGVIAGYYHKTIRLKVPTSIVILSGLAFIALPYFTDSNLWRLAFVAMFFIFYLHHSISFKVINKIGTASYSIYLTHALVVPTAKHLPLGIHAYFEFPLVVMACLALGLLYHRFFESWSVRQAGKYFGSLQTPRRELSHEPPR